MADIKTKDNAKGTIRTIDKAAVATQRMKQAYIATKEKAERSVNANSSSAEEYASDKLESGIDEVVHDGAYAFDKAGRKGVETTKENIRTAKDGIQRFKQQRAEQSLRKQASQNTSSAIKTVDKAEKTIKQSATSSGKKTIKFAGKEATKTAQKSVKTAEQTAKTAIKTSQQAAKAAQKTAQATVKASQKAAQAAKAAGKTNSSWIAIVVGVAVVIGIGWLFFFNNDITGTWIAEEDGETMEVVFDQGGTGTISLVGSTSSRDRADFTYEMNDGYLLIQTKTTLYSFGKNTRFPCEVHGNTMTWNVNGETITLNRK